MQELITITTGEQGSPVVKSARELYEFLGLNKTAFSRWAKKNIETNKFAREGEDWEGFDMMSNGNEVKDYALTLDFAKRLSMLARTEKGEEARRYFLECEKRLQAPAQLSTEQVLIQLVSQQNQLMAGTQELLSQLRAEVDQIKAGNRPARPGASRRAMGQQLGLPGIPPPTPSLRPLINRKIDEYCDRSGYDRRDTWNYLYKRLFQIYGIDAHRLQRIGSESMLDAIERYGHLDRLYTLIMAELTYSEDEQ